nr:MAG TPA: hypothetical protein [Caudoviricetes sp.]DAS15514.1 MAG TPA: hypothetical protein [Caudoviricetes sp.]DAT43417.1 MAG TPA: hypothetical protein [Caudoviricetes sp.]
MSAQRRYHKAITQTKRRKHGAHTKGVHYEKPLY